MGQAGRKDKVRLTVDPGEFYATESRRFVLWLPVLMGLGIWVYFSQAVEPPWAVGLSVVIPTLWLASGQPRRLGWGALALAWMAVAVTGGFGLAVLSARLAEAPRISFPLGETVEGRITGVSRSASGAPRILLEDVTVYGLARDETPVRVRLTLLETPRDAVPPPGTRVRVYATLLPNGEPVEPGAFDFQRRAFFDRLGGIGLARGRLIAVPEDGLGLITTARIALARMRASVSDHLRAAIPGAPGAFAAAIIVGDRSDIGEADQEALRASNLAHLLAISGLHMGMLTGLIFAAVRIGFALVPVIALRFSTKKLAAVAALVAGLCYLGMSGATVATQRAFIMVAVMFMAVLLDRPAISLRGLALAAAIVLAVRPVSLLEPGFQMSFAATAALVGGYEVLRDWRAPRLGADRPLVLRLGWMIVLYFGGLMVSSLLAGIATSPIAAYHFNRTAPYGLVANLMAVPVMGIWIAPMACLAAVLAPLGADGWVLALMGDGIAVVLEIAHWIAGFPGAVRPVRAAPGGVLGCMAFGALWLILWQGRWRLAGGALLAAGLAIWALAPMRPDLLVGVGGKLIGVMGPEGRALDQSRYQSFAAKNWLRRDGDWSAQELAFARPGLTVAGKRVGADLGHGWRLEVSHARAPKATALDALCQPRTVLIARNGPAIRGPCVYYGKDALRASGALAIWITDDGIAIRPAKPAHVDRLWSLR